MRKLLVLAIASGLFGLGCNQATSRHTTGTAGPPTTPATHQTPPTTSGPPKSATETPKAEPPKTGEPKPEPPKAGPQKTEPKPGSK